MSLKAKIQILNQRAGVIHKNSYDLNIAASELNGVAVVIPDNVAPPASYFKGSKAILSNVSFDNDAGCICANISLPHHREDVAAKGYAASGRFKYDINETWFK